jgi:hypothetical protein
MLALDDEIIYSMSMGKERVPNCGKCGALKITLKSGALRCQPCARVRNLAYYHRSAHRREMERRSYVLRRYGVRLEQLDAVLSEQHGRCAICEKDWRSCVPAKRTQYETGFLHHLCIDHDHTRKRARGLLCNSCNTAVGLFEEDAVRFVNAMLYLQKYDHD